MASRSRKRGRGVGKVGRPMQLSVCEEPRIKRTANVDAMFGRHAASDSFKSIGQGAVSNVGRYIAHTPVIERLTRERQ